MSADERETSEKALLNNPEENKIREACRICEFPGPVGADITFGLMGSGESELAIMVKDDLAKEMSGKLSVDLEDGLPEGREDAVGRVVSKRKETRSRIIGEIKDKVNGMDKFLATFSACIRCHNCMNACPICYCKECVFNSSIFEHSSDQYLKLAERKGALRMPSDTLMFHLTRLSHMATSCVGCGLCESACPSHLPVSSLFSLIGSDLQEMFQYEPGSNASEEPPVTTFKEEELKTETGTSG